MTIIITTFALLFVPTQSVMADPGIGAVADPSLVTVGGTTDVGGTGALSEEYTGVRIRVYDTMPIASASTGSLITDATPLVADSCAFNVHPVLGGRYWDYYSSGSGADARLRMLVAATAVTPQLALVRFGDGGDAQVGFFSSGVSVDPAQLAPRVWRDNTAGISTDTIDLVTGPGEVWAVAVCANRHLANADPSTAGTFQATTFQVAAFNTQKPVAGEILPIDTTALLIAGVSQNSLWILPTLALVAGAAFTLLRIQVHRK